MFIGKWACGLAWLEHTTDNRAVRSSNAASDVHFHTSGLWKSPQAHGKRQNADEVGFLPFYMLENPDELVSRDFLCMLLRLNIPK